jgi:hypothetical protein
MTNEIYQSSTHGDIPLSFTGRRLLANLRAAVQTAIDEGDFSANDMQLSHARGELAEYMSKLEGKRVERTIEEALAKIERDAAEAEAAARAVAEAAKREALAKAVIDAAREFNAALSKWNSAAKAATDAGMTVCYTPDKPVGGTRIYRHPWPRMTAAVRS